MLCDDDTGVLEELLLLDLHLLLHLSRDDDARVCFQHLRSCVETGLVFNCVKSGWILDHIFKEFSLGGC